MRGARHGAWGLGHGVWFKVKVKVEVKVESSISNLKPST